MTPDNESDSFEKDLRRAMRQVELPEKLERYLDESLVFTPVQEKRWLAAWRMLRSPAVPSFSGLWIAGTATAVLVVCFIVAGLHERTEHQAEATRQFARSESITAQTMAYTRKQMQSKGFPVDLDDE